MSYKSESYLESLDDAELAQFYTDYISLGHHPETCEGFYVSKTDRHSGTYMAGVQGSGKSGEIKNMVAQDIDAGEAIIVLDPHGDLVDDIIAQAREDQLDKMYLLDMTDEEYPFGANLFAITQLTNAIIQAQSVDRIIHVFETLWPETASQQYLPRFLRACILTLLCTSGSNLADMYRLLTDDDFRQQLLKNVTDQTILSFWQLQYDELAVSARMQRVGALIGRLEAILMGRPIIRNIVSQRETTINFREAIERHEILLIKLPVKTLEQDARLLGTILVSLIHSAIFSFADVPLEQRPEVAFYVDEFQNFATPDFGTFFTEARKYKVMLTIAHQYRNQLPSFLQDSTLTARNVVVFQVTPDDSRELATLFPDAETSVKPEDINPHPVEYLLAHGSDNPVVETFIETYLRPLQRQKKGGSIEIRREGFRPQRLLNAFLHVPQPDKPKVADPTQYLNKLLYAAMKAGDPLVQIPSEVVYGFANCGRGFYPEFKWARKDELLHIERIQFPPALVVQTAAGTRWTRRPETSQEQLYHFLYHLIVTLGELVEHPIGKKSTTTTSEVAAMLTQLPRRAAFVRSGEERGVIHTDDTLPMADASTLCKRLELVQAQTRQKYCKPKSEVEKEPNPQKQGQTSRWEVID